MGSLTYDDVAGMPPEAWRVLLVSGDPAERVFAAWCLASSSPGERVHHAIEREPNEGVRRHLAIVVAGLRDDAVLAALARHDPSPRVRARCAVLALQIGRADASHRHVVHAALDDVDEVRVAVLGAMDASDDDAWIAVALAWLGDASLEVREAVFEWLVGRASRIEKAGARLVECAVSEPDARLRARMSRHAFATYRDAYLAALSGAPDDLVLEALRWHARFLDPLPADAVLLGLLGRDASPVAEAVAAELARYMDQLPPVPFLYVFAAAEPGHLLAWIAPLSRACAEVPTASWPRAARRALVSYRARLRAALATPPGHALPTDWDDDTELEEIELGIPEEAWREEAERLLDHLDPIDA